jgi:ABC-type branched-subunit amino acid transport system ATPase component/ABC-type branched-subunit amino acid transport system permease subunit
MHTVRFADSLHAGQFVKRVRARRLVPVRLTAPAASDERSALLGLAAVGIIVSFLLPLIVGTPTLLLAGRSLIIALFALSLNLLVANTGLISFGHAAYFGFGGYTVGVLVVKLGWPSLACLALAPIVGAIVAFISGVVVLRGIELYASLLTLGIAQLYWAVAEGWYNLTGGDNGTFGIFPPRWLSDVHRLYWFVWVIVGICTALLFIVTRSPFGDALRSIRENRLRAEFTGLRVKRYELAAFVIAGTLAAVAGGLSTLWESDVNITSMDWAASALPVIVALIGGMRYFIGPIIGAFFYIFVQDFAVSRTSLFDLAIGVTVLPIALFLPGGLTGALGYLSAPLAEAARRTRAARAPRAAPVIGASVAVPVARLTAGLGEVEDREAAAKQIRIDERGASAGAPVDATAKLVPTAPFREVNILEVRGVTRRFGGLVAVDDVSFGVRQGSLHAIIGPNGAGKTTLFNVISGLLKPTSGSVLFGGDDVTGSPPWRLVDRGMGRSFQQTNLFWSLTTFENVLIANAASEGATRRLIGGHDEQRREECSQLLGRVGLGPFSGIVASDLSHGDQRTLEIATALAVDAKLLLLDEPTAGISPAETHAAVNLIKRIAREQDLTVLFVEHDMAVVFGVADWVTVLHHGRVLADGPPDEVRRNAEVQRAYLGEDVLEGVGT